VNKAWRRPLERELHCKEKALREAWALIVLLKKAEGLSLGGRGRLHTPDVRRRVDALLFEAVANGARASLACQLLGLSLRTLQRWRKSGREQDGRTGARRSPANRLEAYEQAHVLELLHSPDFQGLSPRQIVPRLADQGLYVASESTMYRLLRAHMHPPGRRARPRQEPVRIVSAPNQAWCWDITYLKGPSRGTFFYLYLVMDIFSRRIMGWRIHSEESTRRAAVLIRRACQENAVQPAGLTLYSDNGRPMKGASLLSALRRLGIIPSFSRPRVSNDNAFAEALFHTLKGRPFYPTQGFSSLREARAWMARFVEWYNQEHLHSGLGYVTPNDRYFGRDAKVLKRRARLYARARAKQPLRWSLHVRSWAPAEFPRVLLRVSSPSGAASATSPPTVVAAGDNPLDTYRCNES
jgi:transposase InsO family protein